MAGSDTVVFNNLERALSTDINDLQSMRDRAVADILQYGMQNRGYSVSGTAPTESNRDVVIGGLVVTASGSDVVVSRGCLAQYSASLPPTPGALDSNYRVAFLRTPETIAAPAPGGNTYYLLEAQMTEVVTVNTSRDIYDVGTGLFVPTPVDKQKERRIQFQFTAGTSTAIPSPTTGWVPIAGVFRAGGGGAVAQGDIIDVRPFAPSHPDTAGGIVDSYRLETSVSASTSKQVMIDLSGFHKGHRVFARSEDISTRTNFQLDPVREAGHAFAVYTLHYIYLAAWNGTYPSGYVDATAHRGCLVLSKTAPDRETGLNSGAITLQEPFDGYVVPAGDALCVGAMLQNAQASGLNPQACTRGGHHTLMGDHEFAFGLAILNSGAQEATINHDTNGDDGREDIPYNATTVLVQMVTGSSAASLQNSFVRIQDAPGGGGGDLVSPQRLDFGAGTSVVFEAPLLGAGVSPRELTYRSQDAIAGTGSCTVKLLGWKY